MWVIETFLAGFFSSVVPLTQQTHIFIGWNLMLVGSIALGSILDRPPQKHLGYYRAVVTSIYVFHASLSRCYQVSQNWGTKCLIVHNVTVYVSCTIFYRKIFLFLLRIWPNGNSPVLRSFMNNVL